MNIKQAKQEIKHTVQAYLAKDEDGIYRIPSIRQRPVLLMGPPGIGKTAIMEQAADECGIALVSYTITHHTRQSAIGLPFISKQNYGGKEYTITEYTMSEIIASVYEKMEETGLQEGILFIDEINCVSETLAPTMLQFLQRKSFGSHTVPDGWVIVAAGNPPEYNKSVRDFDIVTLDRLKRIDVEESFDAWKPYAYRNHVHPAIISYLEIKKQHFYTIETTVDGKAFVTARGWEDLSSFLLTSELLYLPVNADVVSEYLQHPQIARDFASYYDLYRKYQSTYQIDEILSGELPVAAIGRLQKAPFDERLSVIGLLIGRLTGLFSELHYEEMMLERAFRSLKYCKTQIANASSENTLSALLDQESDMIRFTLETRRKAAAIDPKEAKALLKAADLLGTYRQLAAPFETSEEGFATVADAFGELSDAYEEKTEAAASSLESAFAFLENVFGRSQEMVVFITELNTDFYSTEFIAANGSEAYARWNKELMIHKQQQDLLEDIQKSAIFLSGL